MTKQELNRDIKRLYKYYLDNVASGDQSEFNFAYFNSEFKRLYYADLKAEYLSYNNFKIMIVLNRRFNVIKHHQLYINIDL